MVAALYHGGIAGRQRACSMRLHLQQPRVVVVAMPIVAVQLRPELTENMYRKDCLLGQNRS